MAAFFLFILIEVEIRFRSFSFVFKFVILFFFTGSLLRVALTDKYLSLSIYTFVNLSLATLLMSKSYNK